MAAMKDNVEFCRPEHVANLEIWRLVSDACAGQAAVRLGRERYLPRPNPLDKSAEADARYEQYLLRAVYYNACGRTLTGLVGLAFSTFPEIKLPKVLEYLNDDVDGADVDLVQQAQTVMGQVLKTGRAGLLVDFPPAVGGVSVADVEEQGVRATINYYPAHSIINWRTERRGGAQILTLVVLREAKESFGEFSYSTTPQYRVLRLADGVYTVEIWTKPDDAEEYQLTESYAPLNGDGQQWDEIPFVFVGAVTNTPELHVFGDHQRHGMADRMVSPLYDIAVVNMAHYRNSADYEDSAFLVGQPQPWMAGLDVEWRDTLIKEGVYIGSRSVIPLPQGGAFGLAQASPNTLVGEAMKNKEELMYALGARLIQKPVGKITATQANHEHAKENSVLSLVCDNVSSAYETALNWACEFMGAPEEAEFGIDTEFSIKTLDAQSILAVVQAWQAKLVPKSDAWSSMRNFGLIDASKSDDEIQAELDAEPPSAAVLALQGNGLPGKQGQPPADVKQPANGSG